MHRLVHITVELLVEFIQRWPAVRCRNQAHSHCRPLGGDGIRFNEKLLVKGLELVPYPLHLCLVSSQRRHHQIMLGFRGQVGHDRDAPVSTPHNKLGIGAVVTTQKEELIACELAELIHSRQVSGRLLYANDVFVIRDERNTLRLEINHGTSRDVVDNNRQSKVCHGQEVLDKPSLRRLHVVRGDDEGSVASNVDRLERHLLHVLRIDRAGACQDWDLPLDFFHGSSQNSCSLVHGHHGGLSSGAKDAKAIRAILDMESKELPQCRHINFPLCCKWRY
mmetsp:Transcript_23700/g.43799  ORF Transcript_23700/g.43799 Transcript_23700/m.43799 type:complete len:278 (+) Transcript_23700:193-1026(+)